MIGSNKRKLLQTVDDSFNELYETKQNKVWYSDAEPADTDSEDGDLWFDITSSTPPPIEYRDVDLSDYAANNIDNYTTITELPQEHVDYLSSGLRATNMRRMFYNCQKLESLDFNKYRIDTSKCTVMSHAFNTCVNLKELDLSSFDTSSCTNMSYMFYSCNPIKLIIPFNTSNVTSMSMMFYNSDIDEIAGLESFDTHNVTDMSYMFQYFNRYSKLTGLDLSSFDVSKVTDMSYMFDQSRFTTLDLSSFNLSSIANVQNMLSSIDNLTNLIFPNKPKTTNNVNMSYMVYGNDKLTVLDLNNFDTSDATNMAYMFSGCSSLSQIKGIIDMGNVTNKDTSNTYYRDMFKNCPITTNTPVFIKNPPTTNYWWEYAGLSDPAKYVQIY